MRLRSSSVCAKQIRLLNGHCAAELVCVGQPPKIVKVALHGCWELERGSQDSLMFLFSGQVLNLHAELRTIALHAGAATLLGCRTTVALGGCCSQLDVAAQVAVAGLALVCLSSWECKIGQLVVEQPYSLNPA